MIKVADYFKGSRLVKVVFPGELKNTLEQFDEPGLLTVISAVVVDIICLSKDRPLVEFYMKEKAREMVDLGVDFDAIANMPMYDFKRMVSVVFEKVAQELDAKKNEV